MRRLSRPAWFLLCLALLLSAPAKAALSAQADSDRHNVMIVLDVSASMMETDPFQEGGDANRYDAIRHFVDLLSEEGDCLGYVAFAGAIAEEAEPREIRGEASKNEIVSQLQNVAPDKNYTDIGLALTRAVQLLRAKEAGNGLPSVIVLLSDGSDDPVPGTASTLSAAVSAARDAGIPVYCVCLDVPNTRFPPTPGTMRAIAEETGGEFMDVKDASDLPGVFEQFYQLIYGQRSYTIYDGRIPAGGELEKRFRVPGFGVREINVDLVGDAASVTLSPAGGGAEYDVPRRSNISSYFFRKITRENIVAGEWILRVAGDPNATIQVNLVPAVDLKVDLRVEPGPDAAGRVDNSGPVTVRAVMRTGDESARRREQYEGYQASLEMTDGSGRRTPFPMASPVADGQGFSLVMPMDGGPYRFRVEVRSVEPVNADGTGDYITSSSEEAGPWTFEAENRPPVPADAAKDGIRATVRPGGTYTLALTGLATDPEDGDRLEYALEAPSEVFAVTDGGDGPVLRAAALRSGASCVIVARDSAGASCAIPVELSVGIALPWLLLCVLAVLALTAAAVWAAVRFLGGSRFYGTISVSSEVNGYRRNADPLNPSRGRVPLSAFGVDDIGLDPRKSCFQATGQPYIWFVPSSPVSTWQEQNLTKVRLETGAPPKDIFLPGDNARRLSLQFTSRKAVSRKSAGARGGRGGYRNTDLGGGSGPRMGRSKKRGV